MRKEQKVLDEDDLERRLWRTMPWDAEVMEPKPDEDEESDAD